MSVERLTCGSGRLRCPLGIKKQISNMQSTVTVTLPGFQGRTTKIQQRWSTATQRKKKQSTVEITCSDNCDFQFKTSKSVS